MTRLQKLQVLVVEAHQGMRAQLRSMLDSFDITGVQFAPSAGAAVRKLRERQFDLILCDHDLGEGQDGQHLLEDLRSQRIIPLETLFIMISSERNYERVIGAAELAPNDYILKPLTPGTLLARLQRALAKREAFLPAYRRVETGDSEGAIEACLLAEQEYPAYRTDFMRLRAELLDQQGQTGKAETVYRAILELKSIPWARLGLARTLYRSKRFDEAEQILEGLVAESNYYLDAYDWLARVREAMNRPEQARSVLVDAVGLSPHRISRLRHLGAVSVSAGDYEGAERALSEVVRKSKYSDFRDPQDHVDLVKTQVMQNRFNEAQASIDDLERSMSGRPGAPSCTQLARGLLLQASGKHDEARSALSRAVELSRGAPLSLALKQELVKACLAARLEDESSELVIDILRNAEEESTISSTHALLRECGREDLSERVDERLHEEVKRYITTGAEKAQAGDYDGAVSEMMNAVRKLPGNPHVLFNAALALLRHIEHRGWNERFAAQAQMLIVRTRRLDPANPRLDAISSFMQSLLKKFGIHAGSTPGSRKRQDVRSFFANASPR